MKNINKDEHSKFEKSWEEAFNGAELEPSEDVWLKIDSTLANQESKGFKRTIAFYKYAAAASFLLLLSTAVISYYIFNFNAEPSQEMAKGTELKEESITQNERLKEESNAQTPAFEDSIIAHQDENLIQEQFSDKNSVEIGDTKYLSSKEKASSEKERFSNESNNVNVKENSSDIDGTLAKMDKDSKMLMSPTHEKDKNQLFSGEKVTNSFENGTPGKNSTIDLLASREFQPFELKKVPLQIEIFRVPDISFKEKTEKSSSSKGYFAGVQFSPGYFDPNIQMNTTKAISVLSANQASYANVGVNPSTQEQDLQPQISYTYGMNFGLKLAKRWLLNMGVQYAKNNTTGTTQQFFDIDENKRYLATPATLSSDVNESSNDMAFRGTSWTVNPIDLNNNFEFASIPVKAGFIVIDKKISWIISTGLATDIFLKNEIQDQSGNFDKQVIKPGELSPFRNVFFNGLASSEIVFRFTENYSISLEPSFRTAISSFTKSESLISSHPQSFGVAAGFRYSF